LKRVMASGIGQSDTNTFQTSAMTDHMMWFADVIGGLLRHGVPRNPGLLFSKYRSSTYGSRLAAGSTRLYCLWLLALSNNID